MYQDDAAFWALIAAVMGFMVFVAIIAYVVGSFFMMKLFDKAGVQGRWRAWVPVYNFMVFFKLGDLSPWLVLYAIGGACLLGLIPGVNAISGLLALAFHVAAALAAYRIGMKLGKEPVWVVLFVLLEIVCLGIMGLDKSRWNPNVPRAQWAGNGFLGDNTVWDGVPVQTSAAAAPPAYGQPGYGQPGQPGYDQPTQPGYGPTTTPPAYGQPTPPPAYGQPGYPAQPAAPTTPPATPPAPPTTPPAPPATPPRTDGDGDDQPPVVPPMQP